ncbi:MAG: hypothetical protein EBT37_12090, partial [Betaproteobacteria bacterium]|nr:hypothetical protein [Betaproteobacteria bacterium]
MQWARAHGVPSMLDGDISPAQDLTALAPWADWVVFSEAGLGHAYGVGGEAGLDLALKADADGRAPVAVAQTLGSQGVRWKRVGQPLQHISAWPVGPVVDTLGAGDVFHAALGLALWEGLDDTAAMRWVLEQMLAEMGTSLADILTLEPIGVLARHAWRGSAQRLDLLADTQASADAIARFSSPQEAKRFLGFCRETRALYDALEKPYIRSERPNLLSMVGDLGIGGMTTLAGLGPFASLWRSLGRHFHDPRLQQLFGRYATYCGSSPWSAPATLMLVAQVELDGVWSVQGGMFAVAQALASLGEKYGVQSRYGQACTQILLANGKVSGVQLASGEVIAADDVVFNGDVAALSQGLLGEALRPAFKPVPAATR